MRGAEGGAGRGGGGPAGGGAGGGPGTPAIVVLLSVAELSGQGGGHLGGRQPEEGGGVGGQGGGEQQHVGAAQARPPAGEGEGEGGKYRKLCDCVIEYPLLPYTISCSLFPCSQRTWQTGNPSWRIRIKT